MPWPTKVFALLLCALLFVLVFELVRKKRVREEYSLLWLASTAGLLLLVLFDGITLRIIRFLGGVNLSSFFFFTGVFFCTILLLHLTVQISDLKRKQNVLLQEIGLLKLDVEQRTDGRELVQGR